MSDSTARLLDETFVQDLDRIAVETVFCDERGSESRRRLRPLSALLAPIAAARRPAAASVSI